MEDGLRISIYNDYTNIIKVIYMETTQAHLRKWGRSLGVVIPKEVLEKEGIKVNDKVEILIKKKSNPVKETFGTLKFKNSTQEMLDMVDEELWND